MKEQLCTRYSKRRVWDSNPRFLSESLVFKTSSLNHSDNSPNSALLSYHSVQNMSSTFFNFLKLFSILYIIKIQLLLFALFQKAFRNQYIFRCGYFNILITTFKHYTTDISVTLYHHSIIRNGVIFFCNCFIIRRKS